MPSNKTADAAADTESKPKKSKRKIIFLILLFMLLAAAGAGGSFWFFNLRDPAPNHTAGNSSGELAENASAASSTSSASSAAPAADLPRTSVNILPLSTLTVNLSDVTGERYLTLGLEVELSTAEAAQELKAQQARVRDALIILLSSKNYAELASPEGKLQLKNDIAARLNQILGVPRVIRIYFTEFVAS